MTTDAIPLKRFFETVEERLSAWSADELRSILRAMAQEVAPKDRQAFLKSLVPSVEVHEVIQNALRQDDLLSEIDDLVAEIRAEMDDAEDSYEDDYHDHWDDEDGLGPYEHFVAPLEALFDRTAGVFDRGNLALACEAYRRLFDSFDMEDDYDRRIAASDLVNTDVRAARGRYLRALYDTEAPENRPERLLDMMEFLRTLDWREPPMIEDVIAASNQPLSDRDPFLRAWIALLREEQGSTAESLLREAIRLLEGTRGLEAFARKEGKTHPRAYLDWLNALQAEGNPAKVVAAANVALKALPGDRPISAAVADLLCEAARQLEDTATLQNGRRVALAAKPDLGRLLDLWEVTSKEKRRTTMRQVAQQLDQALNRQKERLNQVPDAGRGDVLMAPANIDRSLLAHARILGGDWEAAQTIAAVGDDLRWSWAENSPGLIVSAFLMILSGQPTAPPANLARLWNWALEHSRFRPALRKKIRLV